MSRGVEFAKRGDFLTGNDNNGFDIDSYGSYQRKTPRNTSTRITNDDGSRVYSRSANFDPGAWTSGLDEKDARLSKRYEKNVYGIDHKISEDSATNRNTRINAGEFDCLQFIKNCLGIRGGRRGGGDGDNVTLEDIRSFLDSHSDIKDMLMKQECPLNPSETMKSDVKELMDMMEKYGPVTMNELYPKGGRKRRSRRTKRRKGKSRRRYSKRR
jgi:hypothetical protein